MRLPGARERHLTYCTNIHPGESWEEVRENLERLVVPVRERVAPGRPFGLGLRLSARAARSLAEPATLEELRGVLEEHGLYLFTINGFPYGPFHGRPVKERVYLPDWLDPERLAYTDRLAGLLAALLPEGVEGTVSTVPGAFGARVRDAGDAERIADAMVRHAAHLVRLRDATGRRVALAVEPEPCCQLETVEETVSFFRERLFGARAVRLLGEEAGLARGDAEAALREHLGVCYDTCHMAVEWEDPAASLHAFRDAGIRIAKVQVSAGLEVDWAEQGAPALAELERFAEDVYLHQVVERRPDGRLRRYLDLPEALAAAGAGGVGARGEWRVHFHVPLFHERLGPFRSTREHARRVLSLDPPCAHYEVETYTWDVLPPELRAEGVVEAVAREVGWAAGVMAGGELSGPRPGTPASG